MNLLEIFRHCDQVKHFHFYDAKHCSAPSTAFSNHRNYWLLCLCRTLCFVNNLITCTNLTPESCPVYQGWGFPPYPFVLSTKPFSM